MHDAVGVDVDELPKAVGRVMRPHEPTFDSCCCPLGVQGIGVGDVDGDDGSDAIEDHLGHDERR